MLLLFLLIKLTTKLPLTELENEYIHGQPNSGGNTTV